MTPSWPSFIPPPDPNKVATGFTLVMGQPIPPPGSFHSAAQKFSRAGYHIEAIESFIDQYVQSCPMSFGNEIGPDGNVNITIERYVDPPEIGLAVGDAIHNMRAALDSLAGDLAIRSGKSAKGVYFPIVFSEQDLNEQIKDKKFNRAGKDCEALLRSLRPWKGGNEALRALHELDIIDKHSTIAPVSMAAVTPLLSLTGEEGLVGRGIVPSAIIFSFAEGGPLGGQEIIPALHHLAETVKGILEAFAALVANRT